MNIAPEILNNYNLPKWIALVILFITLLPILYRGLKSILKLSQLINFKKLKKQKDFIFPIIAISILPIAFMYIHFWVKILFGVFSWNYNFYLYFIAFLLIFWLLIYIILGFQSSLKLSLISHDLTNYTSYINQKYKHERQKESQFFSLAINNSKYTTSKFKSIKKAIMNEYNFKKSYTRLKITKKYTRRINELVIIGCVLNGFLIYALFFAGKNPMAAFIYIFIILIFTVQTFYLYRLNVSMKNYDHLKHYREENDEDDKEG
ncbi:hypothetical protein [Staphylococcus saprophyticus]|uniref:hypothetical protein n=1 Tax=Staphylococcus saprophyticus TaxID=29385 RepID=UPI00085350BF|nr:hypothetical protein [Staphylococcus saprophyticus]OEK44576.1 hypothetical protein ASS92_10920 [Staphylococcus saprophyticus]